MVTSISEAAIAMQEVATGAKYSSTDKTSTRTRTRKSSAAAKSKLRQTPAAQAK